ncbi:hypothetical protein D0962_11625 [Leptolyngbyaceae cyanobacterium CCMR0082]|uniref:Carboxypeptidase regulatory-like domain-containing protein n=2 Tax=Adonisia TaxID=2950183 RepID=A0A6M0S4M4_9CYAN|nr:hypothetical protein [Adonisia turfae CCMR0082]
MMVCMTAITRRLMISIMVPCLSFIGSCVVEDSVSSQVIAEQTQASNNMEQGIQGKVIQLSGDFMPQIGATGESQNSQSALATNIWVFTGKIQPEILDPQWISTVNARDHAQLLQVVESDSNGEFSIALEPGVYTLFSQNNEALYLNSFDGEGYYASVDVKTGAISAVELVNSEGAVF